MPCPHFWAAPDRLPADLPRHEVWQREMPFKLSGTPSAHPPHTAPGFQRALRMGICPPPAPASPPQPLPGLSSVQLLVLLIVLGLGFVLLQAAVQRDGVPMAVRLAACALVLPVGWGVWTMWRRLLRRDRAEAAAGYTVWGGEFGLWRLHPVTGRVRREPDRSVPPAGYYPSPYFPGVPQYWDGPDWGPLPHRWWREWSLDRYFRRPPVDFLGVGNVEVGGPPTC